MRFKVYMLELQGVYKTREEAEERIKKLESVYKNLKLEVREE